MVERKIKELLVRVLHLDVDPSEIGDHELLFDGLGLDSLAALKLVAGIEEEFGIRVEDEELTVELFESVASLSEFVRRKLGTGGTV
ncbi:MAG: acyl carrier protein [Candidatus Latescibacterota bacterium]|nr:MAG: acyl carrier protein [Candidatus Latescibacterota bacterium]